MTYFIHFYEECPATGMDIEIEITFTCDEEEEQEFFWGFPVSVPASNNIEILEVVKNGETWNSYPDSITDEIHKHDWEPMTDFPMVMVQEPAAKYFINTRLNTEIVYMLPNDLFAQLFSFFLVHSSGYELKKELQSEQKSLFGFSIKNLSIKSIKQTNLCNKRQLAA